MIAPIMPHRWRSIRATVGDSVEIPISADSVSILPAGEGSDEVTVSFFASYFAEQSDTELETESRPIEIATVGRDETSRRAFPYYSTIVPTQHGESATVYFLGETDEERRML